MIPRPKRDRATRDRHLGALYSTVFSFGLGRVRTKVSGSSVSVITAAVVRPAEVAAVLPSTLACSFAARSAVTRTKFAAVFIAVSIAVRPADSARSAAKGTVFVAAGTITARITSIRTACAGRAFVVLTSAVAEVSLSILIASAGTVFAAWAFVTVFAGTPIFVPIAASVLVPVCH